ncbi:response regulator transcription factor [Anaerocolumna sp. MB42-C2]|uniref:response regulator transcription factor n=1 Tax=Anaerocolumna sp. MB42-C2 TaxID=3070997 RepID=UPI0027DF549B|nr:response regulator [Anaerocolumna sp. MB42-C2]WMJ90569.1 response regulator [Anaerocolumna sp. MB42-C2]
MCKVMIIDDERAIRNLLKITLEKENSELIVVGEAASGIEAINTIDNYKPDVAFVDIRMPFMDGIEFSKLAIKRYPRLKIIILTAFNDFEYARKCVGIGVFEYLLKPISREEIHETLTRVIDQIKSEQPDREEEIVQDDSNHTILQIKEYINNNFQDAEINLTSIAQQFGFNSSYLSRVFKLKTGIGLIEYLTQCRMEKAIICAQKGVLMYVTAKEVGIPDPNYFGKCFKKYTGLVYSEYINKTGETKD